MSEYQLPQALCQRQGGHISPRLEEVLDAVRDLNLAKTALRKMMALLEDPGVESEVFVCARVRMCARASMRAHLSLQPTRRAAKKSAAQTSSIPDKN